MTRATVNTDASWCPNTKSGGWAAWIAIDGQKDKLKVSGRFHTKAKSSNEAELWALLNGVWIAAQNGATVLLVQSDCLHALRLVAQGTDDGVRLLYKSLPISVKITTRHVKGHASDTSARTWVNNWCDREAKKHMRAQRGNIPNKR